MMVFLPGSTVIVLSFEPLFPNVRIASITWQGHSSNGVFSKERIVQTTFPFLPSWFTEVFPFAVHNLGCSMQDLLAVISMTTVLCVAVTQLSTVTFRSSFLKPA